MGWNSNAPMPQKWLHVQTHTLQSAMYSSQHTAQCLMPVRVPYAQWSQLLNQGPTQALHLAKGLAGFHLQSQAEQSTQLALHFIGKFVKTSYTGVQVLLRAIRKNENQAKPIHGKLLMKKCFLRWQSCQAGGLSDNRRNLFWLTVCQKGWNPGRILKMSGKCGYFQYCHRDFVWPWKSGLTPALNHNFSLPPKAERWQECLQFHPLCKGIGNSNTLDR